MRCLLCMQRLTCRACHVHHHDSKEQSPDTLALSAPLPLLRASTLTMQCGRQMSMPPVDDSDHVTIATRGLAHVSPGRAGVPGARRSSRVVRQRGCDR